MEVSAYADYLTQADLRLLARAVGASAAAVAELGHAPRFSMEEGLRRTLEWYRRTGQQAA